MGKAFCDAPPTLGACGLRLAFAMLLAVALLDVATLADAWRTPCLTAEQRNELPAPRPDGSDATALRVRTQPDPDGCGVPRTRESAAWLALRLDLFGLAATGLAFLGGRHARVLCAASTLGAALFLALISFLWLPWGVGCGAWESRFGDRCVWLGSLFLPALAVLCLATWAIATGTLRRRA